MLLRKPVAWLGFALLVIAPRALHAADLLNTPVYDPESKSYFEMVDGAHGLVKGYGSNEGPTWAQAEVFAKGMSYKDVPGRLATVRTFATHAFLMRTFHPSSRAWIGLRYWCGSEQLEDSTGRMLSRNEFIAWAQNWRGGDFICVPDPSTHRPSPTDYAPVAYSAMSEGFRWVALGSNKRFYFFFVEFPTGKQ